MFRFVKFLLVLCFWVPAKTSAQVDPAFVLIRPTGKTIQSLPEMEVIPDSTEIARKTYHAVRNTFMGEAIALYHLAQRYLIHTGKLEAAHPAYLAITRNQGGFARKGFFLKAPDGSRSDKTDAHYVDLVQGSITAPLDRIMSVTQLYPHELGHVIYRMLSETDSAGPPQSFNVNMHYFSVITDYNTAFNEGFAEHIENISRLFEPNDTIKHGIQKNIEKARPLLEQRGNGFMRDYQWPFRMGFYKVTMPVWYQQFENYKRYVHAVDEQACFVNTSPPLRDIHNRITLRNTGLAQHPDRRKNIVQRMASEGFVSTFFTHLALSDLPHRYRNTDFYKPFLSDTTVQIIPEQHFTPVQNLFLKYFHVLHRHVRFGHSETAFLLDFINGYRLEYPDEAELMLDVYTRLTGEPFQAELPPPLWFLVKNYPHAVLVLDAFGAITVPVYTFDINAAEVEDIMTINGISLNEAEKLIAYRNQTGLFNSYEEIFENAELDPRIQDLLRTHQMDESYFESLEEDNLSIAPLILTPLVNLLKQSAFFFILIALSTYITWPKQRSLSNLMATLFKYYLVWLLFIIVSLMAVILSGKPVITLLGFVLLYGFVIALLLRRRKQVLQRHLIAITAMTIMLGYALV